MKNLFLLSFLLTFIACDTSLPTVSMVKPNKPNDTPPHDNTPPEQNIPKEPQPLYKCTSPSTDFSRIEIWWSKQTLLTEVFQGDLEDCQNTPEAGLELTFPGSGTTVNVDGQTITRWMVMKVFNDQEIVRLYFQYSDFVSRSSGCNQGLFLSEDKKLIDIKINEPKSYKGTLDTENQTIHLKCSF